MTTYKVETLLHAYETAMAKAGYEPGERTEAYSLVGTTDEKKASTGHIGWMIAETRSLLKLGKVAKAMRWLGFIQHAMIDLGIFKLEDIKDQAKNLDEYEIPPPPGMATMQAKVHVIIMTPIGALCVLVRQTWLPAGMQPQMVKFPNIDPERRLGVLEDLGIVPNWEIAVREWDYTDCSLNLFLKPTVVHPGLSEESVALAIGMYKLAGWDYQDEDARKWPERFAQHKERMKKGGGPDARGHHPSCPNHPHNHGPQVVPHGMMPQDVMQQLFGGMIMGAPQIVMGGPGEFGPGDVDDEDDEDDTPLPPKPQPKKRKRKPKPNKKTPPPGGKTDGGDKGEGSPDAAGPKG